MFITIDLEWNRVGSKRAVTAPRMHLYDPISSGYLTTVFDISRRRYDAIILLIEALTVTPVLFSNALSCQAIVDWVFDTTLLSDLFSWMIEMLIRFVPFTTQLISIPDLPNSINEGSTSIDMEANAENKRF